MMSLEYYLSKLKEQVQLRKLSRRVREYKKHEHIPSFFILSSGRSGSTLLRKLLMEQTNTYIPPESGDIIVQAAKILLINNCSSWKLCIEQIIKLIEKQGINEFWKLDLESIKYTLLDLPEKDRNFYSVIKILYTSANSTGIKRTIGDKTPYLALRTEWLSTLYPESKFIYLLRDGRDVVASRMKAFNESLEVAADRWLWSLKGIEKLKSSNVIIIKYEDLVSKPEQSLTQIIDFLNLDKSLVSNRPELGDDLLFHHGNLAKPVFDNSIGNWQQDLNQKEKEQLNLLIKEMLIHYEYPL